MVGDSCFVFRVKPESDAERQGVRRGDRIESINGLMPTRANLWQISYLFWVLSPRPSLRVVVRAPDGGSRTLDLASKVHERGKIMDVTGADGGRDIGRLVREGERDADELRGLMFECRSGHPDLEDADIRDSTRRGARRAQARPRPQGAGARFARQRWWLRASHARARGRVEPRRRTRGSNARANQAVATHREGRR